jgi:hypothetical protein
MLPCFKPWITKAKNIHWGLTAGALKNRSGPLFDNGKKNPQNQLHNEQQFLCVAMKKPIVSDPPKPLGQDMLQDEKQKVFSFEGAISSFTGFAFDVLKSNLAILV